MEVTLKDWAVTLYEEYGLLTPEIVREAARPTDSPAHGYVFNVPVDEAAEAHYLERAHRLIQHIRISIREKPHEPPRRIRLFHAVSGNDGHPVYHSIQVIVSDRNKLSELRQAIVNRLREAESALAELEQMEHRPSTVTAIEMTRRAREMVEAA